MKFVLYPVLTVLGVVLTCVMWVQIFQIGPTLETTGISLEAWLGIAFLWCIVSGIVAGGLSRDISIWSTETQVILDDHPLLSKVQKLANDIGLPKAPQIGIYPSLEKNIFSAGPIPSLSVIALSEGLTREDDDVLEALIYGELWKMKNGDTGLLVFCHGVVHGFVLYLARMLAFLLGTSFRNTEGSSSSTYPEIVVSAIATLFLTLWGSLVVLFLSRSRNLKGDDAIAKKYGAPLLAKAQKTLLESDKKERHYDLFTKALKADFPKRQAS